MNFGLLAYPAVAGLYSLAIFKVRAMTQRLGYTEARRERRAEEGELQVLAEEERREEQIEDDFRGSYSSVRPDTDRSESESAQLGRRGADSA